VKSGCVYVFDRHQGGANQWGQVRKVIAPDGRNNDQFGTSLCLDANTLAVGAPFRNEVGSSSGAAYVFEREFDPAAPGTPAPDRWGLRKKLVASDGAGGDQLGFSVALSGDLVVAGAAAATVSGRSSGAAYAFERHAGGANNWGQTRKIFPADGLSGDQFGHSVSMDDATLVVGSRLDDTRGVNKGAAYVFRRDFDPTAPAVPLSNNWGLIEKFLPFASATNSHFGFSVSIRSNTVAVGSSFDGSGQVPDAAYIFRLKFNNPPMFAQPIPDQAVTVGEPFNYLIPLNLPVDCDVRDPLSLTVAMPDGSPLPGWLTFNPTTWTFSGTPGSNDVGSFSVKVTATDQDTATGSTIFQITVLPGVVPPPVLDFDCTMTSNLYEYAFAANPVPGGPPILVCTQDPANRNVYIIYRHRFNDPKLAYSLIVSSDLVNWSNGDGLVDVVRRIPLSDAFENVVLYVRDAASITQPQFFRLVVRCSQ
jgi:hypothetical protein